jgi:predicted PurR-regulated permease PerM
MAISSSSQIIKNTQEVQHYELGSFISGSNEMENAPSIEQNIINNNDKNILNETNEHIQTVLSEIKNLHSSISQVSQKVASLELEVQNLKI